MMDESERNLLERWSETMDKEEFVEIGLKLSPEATREELENLFDRATEGYRQT